MAGAEAASGSAAEAPFRVPLEDVEATEALGAVLARCVERGDVLFLSGELGAGKTSFSRGFLREFFQNPALDVPSPSYLLQFTYSESETAALGSAPKLEAEGIAVDAEATKDKALAAVGSATSRPFAAGRRALVPGCSVHHIDPYRLAVGKIAALIDFEEVFAAVALVEWPDRLGDQVVTADNPPRLHLHLEGVGPQAQGRTAVLTSTTPRWRELLSRWRAEGGPPLADVAKTSGFDDGPQVHAPVRALEAPAPAFALRGLKPLPADPRDWKVLGIESSCDDTGAAVVSGTGAILGECLASQAGVHEKWGGVMPRLAQEAHRGAIDATVEEALRRAGVAPSELSAVAVTVGPGLGLCLEVGVRKGLQIAAEHRLPLVRVHHMEAHAMVSRLPTAEAAAAAPDAAVPQHAFAFPFLTLLVSGGHNMAVLSQGIGRHTILGSTIDDSVGEAFDKTARLLGITQIPGGPHLERLAKEGDSYAHPLPKPLSKSRDPALQKGCDFSFSGLKTAVRMLVEKELPPSRVSELPEEELRAARADFAASFQRVAVDHLCQRAARAAAWARELEPELSVMVVAGGVAANESVRQGLKEAAQSNSLEMRCPPPRLCVDNGVMVAWTGVERLRLGLYEAPPSASGVQLAVEVRPRWPIGVRDSRSQLQKLPKVQKTPKGQKRKRAPREAQEGAAQGAEDPECAPGECVADGDRSAAEQRA